MVDEPVFMPKYPGAGRKPRNKAQIERWPCILGLGLAKGSTAICSGRNKETMEAAMGFGLCPAH